MLTYNTYLTRARALHPDPGSSMGDVVWLTVAILGLAAPAAALDDLLA